MKCSLGISNFLEAISSLSHSILFLYFFALKNEKMNALSSTLPSWTSRSLIRFILLSSFVDGETEAEIYYVTCLGFHNKRWALPCTHPCCLKTCGHPDFSSYSCSTFITSAYCWLYPQNISRSWPSLIAFPLHTCPATFTTHLGDRSNVLLPPVEHILNTAVIENRSWKSHLTPFPSHLGKS